MNSMMDDIFTEPDAVDPDTLANLGPLRRLAGKWKGTCGLDISAKADGPEERSFVEVARFDPIDPQANGPQLFYGLRYHIQIDAPGDDITFHDQTGYWLWEPATGLILQSLAIPRGQVALAAGYAAPDADYFEVRAQRGAPQYGICSTDFLERAFHSFAVTAHSDGSWSYVSEVSLAIAGRDAPLNHRDTNRLMRTSGPVPNPWARKARKKMS